MGSIRKSIREHCDHSRQTRELGKWWRPIWLHRVLFTDFRMIHHVHVVKGSRSLDRERLWIKSNSIWMQFSWWECGMIKRSYCLTTSIGFEFESRLYRGYVNLWCRGHNDLLWSTQKLPQTARSHQEHNHGRISVQARPSENPRTTNRNKAAFGGSWIVPQS